MGGSLVDCRAKIIATWNISRRYGGGGMRIKDCSAFVLKLNTRPVCDISSAQEVVPRVTIHLITHRLLAWSFWKSSVRFECFVLWHRETRRALSLNLSISFQFYDRSAKSPPIGIPLAPMLLFQSKAQSVRFQLFTESVCACFYINFSSGQLTLCAFVWFCYLLSRFLRFGRGEKIKIVRGNKKIMDMCVRRKDRWRVYAWINLHIL